MSAPRYLGPVEDSPLTFSICSLVRHQERYDRLLDSFARLGFTAENTEFLAADNRLANQFDGFTWHKRLLAEARGRYVVFCHDDIELLDQGFDALLTALGKLDDLDPNWLLAGLIGGLWRSNSATTALAGVYADHAGETYRKMKLPRRVETLDEFFILMRRSRPVISSYDLAGFHFYGPDICLQAELLGGSAYAIDFLVRHYGKGERGPSFRDARRAFIVKYSRYFPGRTLHSTTGRVALAPAASASGDVAPGLEQNET